MPKGQENERRVQLASVRGPRGNEGKQQYYANEAKELVCVCVRSLHSLIGRFLRKRLVGKTVHVLIDYIKPKEGDYEERECVTITYGSQNT